MDPFAFTERSLVIETWINKWHYASFCSFTDINNAFGAPHILQCRALVLWEKAQMPNCVWWSDMRSCWCVPLLMWFHFVAALLCLMKHTCKPLLHLEKVKNPAGCFSICKTFSQPIWCSNKGLNERLCFVFFCFYDPLVANSSLLFYGKSSWSEDL